MIHELKGQQVCVQLKDGTYLVGILEDIRNDELILKGMRSDKAQVSGLLGSMLGGLGAGTPAAGAGGSSLWSTIRVGMGMLQFIWPLLGRFFV